VNPAAVAPAETFVADDVQLGMNASEAVLLSDDDDFELLATPGLKKSKKRSHDSAIAPVGRPQRTPKKQKMKDSAQPHDSPMNAVPTTEPIVPEEPTRNRYTVPEDMILRMPEYFKPCDEAEDLLDGFESSAVYEEAHKEEQKEDYWKYYPGWM
jgi:hypothetical protein